MGSSSPIISDGFRLLRDQYSPPPGSAQLATDIKRKGRSAISDYKLLIKGIAKTLNETYTRCEHSY